MSELSNFVIGGIQRTLIRVRLTGTLKEPKVEKQVFQPFKEGVESFLDAPGKLLKQLGPKRKSSEDEGDK